METNLTTPGWLTLNDYAAKYKISLSTLRRRIQSDEADYRFENGKYWLVDRPISRHGRFSQENYAPVEISRLVPTSSDHQPATPGVAGASTLAQAEGILESANQLMGELKRAYISVLQEKESQIMQLKEEVVDLKTLVKILEAENERLRG